MVFACFSRVAAVNKSTLKAIKRVNNVESEFCRFDMKSFQRILLRTALGMGTRVFHKFDQHESHDDKAKITIFYIKIDLISSKFNIILYPLCQS